MQNYRKLDEQDLLIIIMSLNNRYDKLNKVNSLCYDDDIRMYLIDEMNRIQLIKDELIYQFIK